MVTLDFSKIRIHDGSQQNGFEELICQLAHLNPPDDSRYFVRKDGSGGDAGVECYWKLIDDSEIAWQAKYFLDPLKNTQWNEIDESVNSFLQKHPEVKKYYVCLPRDWNDSRKKGRGGKKVKSSWDKWKEWKKKWEEKAKALGRNVEFDYWCKHEISQMLQKRDPKYSGRAEYWFNTPILTHENFKKNVINSKEILGERYDQENHINLPISDYFESISNTDKWHKNIDEQIKRWLQSCKTSSTNILNEAKSSAKQMNVQVSDEIDETNKLFEKILNLRSGSIVSKTEEYLALVERLNDSLYNLKVKFLQNMGQRYYQALLNKINTFQSSINILSNFLSSQIFTSSKLKYGIITGDAGIGKSHLLCDSALERIRKKLPTIFLSGQHYPGGDPVSWIKNSMNLSNLENDIFLSALDSAGEANNTNLLIVIDAINEGERNSGWLHNLQSFIAELLNYPHISLILSCRKSFINYLIPRNIQEKPGVLIVHDGFKGNELEAANKYLAKYGLTMPNIPILSPEFSNPLFLKTCCKSLKEKGAKNFPKNLKGLVKLFKFYLQNIEQKLSIFKKYNPHEKLIEKALLEFASKLYPNETFGLNTSETRDFFEQKDPNTSSGETLLNLLLHESVLSEDISYINGEYIPVVRFTYERFSDFFIAESICSNLDESQIGKACKENGVLYMLFNDEEHHNDNILLAVSIIIAESYKLELVDFCPKEKLNYRLFDNIFTDALIWRTPRVIPPKNS